MEQKWSRNLIVRGALTVGSVLLVLIVSNGCTTDATTGAVELFGVIPVSDNAIDTAEAVANEAKGNGGILGIAGTVVAGAIAWWRNKAALANASNAEKAKAVAGSVIDGVDAILKKIEETQAGGKVWAPSREELLSLVKAAQNSAGTRSEVKELIAEKSAKQ